MSGSTAPWFFEQFRAPNGAALAGGRMYFWVAGSTTVPKAVYADYALTTPLVQPLILDGSGNAPEYFMESGLYKIVVRDSSLISSEGMLGGLVVTRDNVSGAGGGGAGPSVETYTFKVSAGDAADGFASEKLIDSTTITWQIVNVGGVLQMRPVVNLSAVRDYKFKGDASDPVAGFMDAKIENTATVQLSVDSVTHKLRAVYVGPTDDHLVITDLVDLIPGPLGIKLKAGAGMAFNITEDSTNGRVIHISSVDENPITAPLDEVISGDGVGGIKSSPLFKAVAGAVSAETFRANSTAVAITAPNGSIEAKGVASVDQSAWGGVGYAFFGAKGFNPPTNDGTISGLMVNEYSASLYTNNGGSASIGTGVSRLAVYSSQAAIDVPFSGPAFHPTDALVLVGATYASTFHAVFAFFGTGTAFAVPAGSSLNTGVRLSNSSAVGVAITGVATPFTLAVGASRDLVWLLDPSDMVTYRWF